MLYSDLDKKSYLTKLEEKQKLGKLTPDEIKKEKVEALKELKIDIGKTTTMNELYHLFKQVKSLADGILRYRRQYILSGQYGNTVSYKDAITVFMDHAKALEKQTLSDYNQVSAILAEGVVCELVNAAELDQNKQQAFNQFMLMVEQQQTVKQVLSYFEQLIDPKNIFHPTETDHLYKAALLGAAIKVLGMKKNECDLNDISLLNTLHTELKNNQPYFNPGWAHIVSGIHEFIHATEIKDQSKQVLIT